jgi:hypothetical protein
MVIHTDHLIEISCGGVIPGEVLGKADAIPRMEIHGLEGVEVKREE